MVFGFVSPLLGFLLGAWLIIAGIQKLSNPFDFSVTLARLFTTDITSRSIQRIATIFPRAEILVGAAACLFFDSNIVRMSVLSLFLLFLIVLLILSTRFKQFDCGCFGTGTEARELILMRGILSTLAAVGLFVAPSSGALTIQGMVWFECGAWSTLFLGLAALHARELIDQRTGSDYV